MSRLCHIFFSKLDNANRIRGIVIDLRNNYGGDISDLNYFVGKLINSNIVFGATRSKSGLGRDGYLPWVESKIIHDLNYHNKVPIFILTDNFTASLSETIIIALRANHNCTVVGETTYGATGPISDPLVFNSGSFSVGSFMNVETSALEFRTIDNRILESVGIQPDIPVPFNIPALSQGKDLQLEIAIKTLIQ